MSRFTLSELEGVVASRGKEASDASYTAKLIAGGPPLAAKKLGEEAVEVVIASLSKDRKSLIGESADLLYHLLVVLRLGDVRLDEVEAELGRRTSQSGLAEKAARSAS